MKYVMMEGYQKFRLLDAAFVIGSILTFIADQATGQTKIDVRIIDQLEFKPNVGIGMNCYS